MLNKQQTQKLTEILIEEVGKTEVDNIHSDESKRMLVENVKKRLNGEKDEFAINTEADLNDIIENLIEIIFFVIRNIFGKSILTKIFGRIF